MRELKSYSVCSKIVYSDASKSGYAGHAVQSINEMLMDSGRQ